MENDARFISIDGEPVAGIYTYMRFFPSAFPPA
jgi:hypothetical protein